MNRADIRNITTTILIGLLLAPTAYAWTYYKNRQAPSEVLNKANPYKAGNPFAPHNQSYDRTQHNPYSPKSIYNNPEKYAAKIHDPYGKYRGTISPQVGHGKSVTNPYKKFGNHYEEGYADHPYRSTNSDNPYGLFQNPYNPKSVRNNPRYHLHYFDSNGRYLGHGKYDTYDNGSPFSPYSHNPYTPNHTTNPYGLNKRMR